MPLADALPILAAHGLVPGPDGFDVGDLVAFAEGRGWTVSAEQTGRSLPHRRWHANLGARRAHPSPFRSTLSGAGGYGATEGDALAVALASMLRRAGG